MKKGYLKYMFMAVAAVMVGGVALGSSLAALNEESPATTAEISIKDVGVSFGTIECYAETDAEKPVIYPGYELPMNVYVSNSLTEKEGYDIYVKLDIYKQWAGGLSNLKFQNREEIPMVSVLLNAEDLSTVPEGYDVGDWLVADVTDEKVTLICKQPIEPGKGVPAIDGIVFSTAIDNEYAGKDFTLSYQATAVQAIAGQDAIASEFGYFVVMDENGAISGVSEFRGERLGTGIPVTEETVPNTEDSESGNDHGIDFVPVEGLPTSGESGAGN
ncbi:MAG: hypothetical protein HUJ98_05015 [Bacteroidaceae bacterium]|nr:hypothetical protein [Bacteroidaceae bacterium]